MPNFIQPSLSAMLKGQTLDGFLMVKMAQLLTSKTGKKYLDMTLGDISGEVNAKVWDNITEVPTTGQVIRVRGTMEEYNGRNQFRVNKYRLAADTDDYDMATLVPAAPEKPEDMRDYIDRIVDGMKDADLRAIVKARLDGVGEALAYWPAASRLHHAERSGLLHHTTSMLHTAEAILPLYPFLDRDLLCAGVILHDLSKITEIESDKLGNVPGYTAEGQLIGHIVKGVAELEILGRELGTPAEKLMLLEHMILSHHDLPEYGSPKPPMFPEAEVLHTLDMLDARLFEMHRELESVKPGGFTEKIWSLDRRLYRRLDGAEEE